MRSFRVKPGILLKTEIYVQSIHKDSLREDCDIIKVAKKCRR